MRKSKKQAKKRKRKKPDRQPTNRSGSPLSALELVIGEVKDGLPPRERAIEKFVALVSEFVKMCKERGCTVTVKMVGL